MRVKPHSWWGYLVNTGDILFAYGILGLLLLAMRNVKDKTALIVAAVIYGYLLVSLTMSGLFVDFGSVITEHVKAMPLYGLSLASMQGPTTFRLSQADMTADPAGEVAGSAGRTTLVLRSKDFRPRGGRVV